MTIEQILNNAVTVLRKNNIEEATIKARILLANILNLKKEQLITRNTEQVDENIKKEYENQIEKIVQGIPLQYITNYQEFMKLDFYVDENVLIPRQDTEILVEEVISICNKKTNPKILDLCTGSGAIGISLKKYIKDSNIYQSDISINALKIAMKNATLNNVQTTFIESNLFEQIIEKFDIIVSNPPYIKTEVIKTLDKEVQKEPKIALDGGQDGLKFYKEIIDKAYNYLKEDGYVCLEIGYDQKEQVIKLLEDTNKYENIYSKKDLYGNDRIVIAKRR